MDPGRIGELYPHLYHMAERGTWPSIRERGLLSSTAVLDTFGIEGVARFPYESRQRVTKVEVLKGHPQSITLRDQKPMPAIRLEKALRDGMTPEAWYRTINSKVFFWVSFARLLRLLGAREYRALEHDVLTIDTASFVTAYSHAIWLCHMNSGNTWPMPHARGPDTFRRIGDYDANNAGNPRKPVVELVVDYSVPDITKYVVGVQRMRGADVLEKIL